MPKNNDEASVDKYSTEMGKQLEITVWNMINAYFEENPQALVNHHIESYNDFFSKGIYQIFREKNPIQWVADYDQTVEEYRSKCTMYLGGRSGDRLYFGKPVLYDQDEPHYMFPNEARLRNITYATTIHYDVEVEFTDILDASSVEIATGGGFRVGGGTSDEAEEMAEAEGGSFVGGAPKDDAPRKKKKREATSETGITPSDAKQIREYIEQTITKDPITGLVTQRRMMRIEQVYLGKFPIMVQSNLCILHGVPREGRFMMGECRNDPGGYFIVDGKEKVVIPQETFGDNMLYIREGSTSGLKKQSSGRPTMEGRCAAGGSEGWNETSDTYLYSAEIRSVSENVTKPVRTMSIHLVRPTGRYTFGNFVVNIPNVRRPVPLFIVFRALGILSDRDIISMILLDMDRYESMVDSFIPSVHDASIIYTQRNAIEFIAELTKGKKFHHGLEILADYLLPHIGETNYREKAYYLGYMVFRMLCVEAGLELPTDRDHFKYKRMELVGTLLYQLFREYYNLQLKAVFLGFDSQLNKNLGNYAKNMPKLIQDHQRTIFQDQGRILEEGFRKAFKGNWGAFSHTKRIGVVQDMNRLSFNTMISHLRKTNLPIDASLKIVGPRLCHNSQWGFIDPVDTPDGANIGLHKNLAIMTTVSRGYSRQSMIDWLRVMVAMKLVTDYLPFELAAVTKIMINGYWAGCVSNPTECVEKIRTYRRLRMIPIDTSVTFDVKMNTIFIYTDSGRLCRPIFYTEPDADTKILSIMRSTVESKLGHATWSQLVGGFHARRAAAIESAVPYYTRLSEVFEDADPKTETDPKRVAEFLKDRAVIDYIDSSETENALIAFNPHEFMKKSRGDAAVTTHCEIHESLLFGVMGNQVTYPEMNQFPRNLFSCGQSKQACSLYHTNYQMRMDKTAVVLHYGQVPLVKTRYMDMINREENPYGFNAVVAIACYSGYNVEDAILINEGAIQRGMFRTTYYTTYSAHEEKGDPNDSTTEVPIDQLFANIEELIRAGLIVGMKPGYDYSHLDSHGMIREGTPIEDKTMLIGLTATSGSVATKHMRKDASVGTKKGQLGYVDRVYLTEGEEGERIAKVRVREERIPTLGDKFAGRAGQKGTIGMVIPERDMPYTKDGIRPDIIINPHAIPSRMTIGQLVETVTGKACALHGAFADCTAFGQKGQKVEYFGELLQRAFSDEGRDGGFESHGNEVLYNGMTGEQIESSIFIGNVYYMRLKHMVKDKQQSRCLGPRSALTKQPVGGRANDGGLRIGEMERDSLIAHGMAGFLTESLMERGDKYYMAICNKTGLMAIYNPSKNLFMSPMVDGPLRFSGTQLDQIRLETITRFGRNFSIVEIPYALKLFIQEIGTLGIQMRMITADNIDQIESLSYKTIGDGEGMKAITDQLAKVVEIAKGDDETELNRAIQEVAKRRGAEGTEEREEEPESTALKMRGGSDGAGESHTEVEKARMEARSREPYKVGDLVLYKKPGVVSSPVIPNQVWKIVHIHKTESGATLYTIRITNPSPDMKDQEKVQIVTSTKLERVQMPSTEQAGGGAAAPPQPAQLTPISGIAGMPLGVVPPIPQQQVDGGDPVGAMPQMIQQPMMMQTMVPAMTIVPAMMPVGAVPQQPMMGGTMSTGPIGMISTLGNTPHRGGFTKIRFDGADGGDRDQDGRLRMRPSAAGGASPQGGLLVKAAQAVENTAEAIGSGIFKVVKSVIPGQKT